MYNADETRLLPDIVDQYDPFNIREALNNCIAHQDYTRGGKINIVEREDGYLIFSNLGQFIPGSVEKVLLDDSPPENYRNPFLAQAMVNLKMIDTIGSGIRRIFINQKKKFFPMPDYDLTNGRVKVTLTGRVLDMDYAQVLARNPNLGLLEIIMLDKLQKHKPLNDNEVRILKKQGLVEGRRNNLHISKQVAQTTGQEVEYSLARGMDDEYYKRMILQHLEQFGKSNRNDIERMILQKLPESLNQDQKQHKVKNLLQSLRLDGLIYVDDNREWRLERRGLSN
ncbi:ATP-binding protein [Spirosoma agri]|uniref:ATP-binding protein n=1 Tax=Spirosoma agri TaxID=1987381 RepID=UPI001BAFBBED|nr:ATP-binding protein [Spirosoma agri]